MTNKVCIIILMTSYSVSAFYSLNASRICTVVPSQLSYNVQNIYVYLPSTFVNAIAIVTSTVHRVTKLLVSVDFNVSFSLYSKFYAKGFQNKS